MSVRDHGTPVAVWVLGRVKKRAAGLFVVGGCCFDGHRFYSGANLYSVSQEEQRGLLLLQ